MILSCWNRRNIKTNDSLEYAIPWRGSGKSLLRRAQPEGFMKKSKAPRIRGALHLNWVPFCWEKNKHHCSFQSNIQVAIISNVKAFMFILIKYCLWWTLITPRILITEKYFLLVNVTATQAIHSTELLAVIAGVRKHLICLYITGEDIKPLLLNLNSF